MTTPHDVADRIRATLKETRRSINGLPELTGIADKTLRRRLANPGSFTLEELNAIARALDVPLEHLLTVGVNA